MSCKYIIKKQHNSVFLHFTDVVDDNKLIDTFTQVHSDPDYSPAMDQCINFSDITDWQISRYGIEQLAGIAEKFNCLNSRWNTYIVAPDDLVFGYARMYQMLCDEHTVNISIVRTLEAALKLMLMGIEQYPFVITESN
mgnify:CR=1 FL=1